MKLKDSTKARLEKFLERQAKEAEKDMVAHLRNAIASHRRREDADFVATDIHRALISLGEARGIRNASSDITDFFQEEKNKEDVKRRRAEARARDKEEALRSRAIKKIKR